MKVLLVTEVFPPRLGGDGIHVMELALHLQKLGVEASVFTKASEEAGDFPFEVKRVGLKRNDLLGRLSFILCSLFTRPKADIIHAHAAVGGLIGLFYKFFYKKPVVVTVHTIWGESLSSTRAFGIGALLQWIEKAIFTLDFDYYITVTREIADKLNDWGLKNVSFIPNGVNTEKFRPAGNKKLLRKAMGFGDENILLFVGRLVKQKNVGLILGSFAVFKGKDPTAKLLIAGTGPEEAGLRQKVNNLNLEGSVVFLGPVAYEQLPPYYQISDCLLLMSQWEGLPLCALEALSAGIPVVGTAVGGLPEVIKNGRTGYICKKNRPEKVAELIGRALAMERKKVRLETEKIIGNYSWRTVSKEVAGAYKKLGGHPTPQQH